MLKPRLNSVVGLWALTCAAPGVSARCEVILASCDLVKLDMEQLIEVEIAAGIFQRLNQTPATTTVITASDIRAMGATTLSEALRSVPGLNVFSNDKLDRQYYSLRGLEKEQVLVMLDGTNIASLNTGMAQTLGWIDLPLQAVQRIEVVRGPGSAMYGADAFAGVINIITKTQDDIRGTEFGARAGSFDTYQSWLLHGTRYGEVELAAMLEYQTSQGYDAFVGADAQTLFDQRDATQASLAPGNANLAQQGLNLYLNLAWRDWTLRGNYQRGRDKGMGIGLARALDASGRYATERGQVDLGYRNHTWLPDWEFEFATSHQRLSYYATAPVQLFPPGAFGGKYPDGYIGWPDSAEAQTNLKLSGVYKGWRGHALRLGGGYFYGDLYETRHFANYGTDPATGLDLPLNSPVIEISDTAYVYLPEGSRSNTFLFIQDIYALAPDWEFTAGLRYDHYSDFGSTLNPRLALVHQHGPRLTAKALYGTAFHAPSFESLYLQNNPTAVGNPELKPEKIRTYELVLNYLPRPDLALNLSLFNYRMRDVWRFVPDQGSRTRANNSGSQRGHGLELELLWQAAPSLSVHANYAWQRSVDETAQEVPLHPRQQSYLRADWHLAEAWHSNLQLNWVGQRQRGGGDPRPPLAGYFTTDLNLRYRQPDTTWSLAVAVRNVFDRDRRDPSLGPDSKGDLTIPGDLVLAGRNFYLEWQHCF